MERGGRWDPSLEKHTSESGGESCLLTLPRPGGGRDPGPGAWGWEAEELSAHLDVPARGREMWGMGGAARAGGGIRRRRIRGVQSGDLCGAFRTAPGLSLLAAIPPRCPARFLRPRPGPCSRRWGVPEARNCSSWGWVVPGAVPRALGRSHVFSVPHQTQMVARTEIELLQRPLCLMTSVPHGRR